MQILRLLTKARELSPEEVIESERQLENDEDDLCSRLKLIAYYGALPRCETEDSMNRYSSLMLWLIKNNPEHEVHQYVSHPLNNPYFEEMKHVWLELAACLPNSILVLDNAARFFMNSGDFFDAELLWLKAEQLDPFNDKYPMCLTNLFRCWIGRATGAEREVLVNKTIEFGDKTLKLHMQDHPHCFLHTYGKGFLADLITVAKASNHHEIANELKEKYSRLP